MLTSRTSSRGNSEIGKRIRRIDLDEKISPAVAQALHSRGLAAWREGKYSEAEGLYKRALAIREQALGASHPDVALNLNNLGLLYWTQGKYSETEGLYKRALGTREKALGANHRDVGTTGDGA